MHGVFHGLLGETSIAHRLQDGGNLGVEIRAAQHGSPCLQGQYGGFLRGIVSQSAHGQIIVRITPENPMLCRR